MYARDLTGYGKTPPRVEWPHGAKLAVNFAINYEEGAEANPLYGDAARDYRTWVLSPELPAEERDLYQESEWEYGSRVGIWRLVRLFDDYGMPFTLFANAVALEANEALVDHLRTRRCDFVNHGLRSVPQAHDGTEEEQRSYLRESIDRLEAVTQGRVLSSFASPLTTVTRRLLAEQGLLYDSAVTNDDIPYYAMVSGRGFLVVPYALDTNDARFWGGASGPGFMTGVGFFDYLRDTFDVLHEEAQRVPRMMTVGLHARIMRPGRAAGLKRFLEHVSRHADVWVAPRDEIALAFAAQFAPADAWNFAAGEFHARREATRT